MLFFLPGRQIYKTAMCITSKCFNTPLCVKYFFIDRPCLGFISPTRSTRRRTAAAHLPERPQWHLPVPDPQCPGRIRTVLMPLPELFTQKWGRGGQTPVRRGSRSGRYCTMRFKPVFCSCHQLSGAQQQEN